jgi:hypothetical protein
VNFESVTSWSLNARTKLFETGPLHILYASTSDMHVHLVREHVDWVKFMWCSHLKICRNSPDLYWKERRKSKQLQAIPKGGNRQLLTSEESVIFFFSGQSAWDLWWTKSNWNVFFFPCTFLYSSHTIPASPLSIIPAVVNIHSYIIYGMDIGPL